MQKTFNYTGRRKLEKSEFTILLEDKQSPPKFDIKFNFNKEKLPKPNASIYVEVYRKATRQRFDYGKVNNIKKGKFHEITDVDPKGTLLFDIKVVDESEAIGKIIASTTRQSATSPDEYKTSLMSLKSHDLGQEIWKVDFSSGKPKLLVNNKIPNIRDEFKSNAQLQALIYPNAFRLILINYLIGESEDLEGYEEWMAFASQFYDKPNDLEELEDIMDWIDNVIVSFSERFKLTDEYLKILGDEDV